MTSLKIPSGLVSPEYTDCTAPDRLESLDGRVRATLMLIQNEGYSKASIERIAALVNLSVTRLSHLFKDCIGTSPRNYDTQLRLVKAQKLIKHTYLRIKEIQAKCGFNDSSRFARQFKKAFGITPKECRAHAMRDQTPVSLTLNASAEEQRNKSDTQIAKPVQK